jgi:hypothetical protein
VRKKIKTKPGESQSVKLAKRAMARVIDYKRTFASEQGRRVLSDLIAEHYVMNSTYVKGDPQDLAFREGQRQVVLRMLAIMKVDPTEIQQKIEESDRYATTME